MVISGAQSLSKNSKRTCPHLSPLFTRYVTRICDYRDLLETHLSNKDSPESAG